MIVWRKTGKFTSCVLGKTLNGMSPFFMWQTGVGARQSTVVIAQSPSEEGLEQEGHPTVKAFAQNEQMMWSSTNGKTT